MTSTGTRKPRDVQSRANDSIIETDKNFIANLKLFSGESDPVGGVAGQGLNSSPNTPTGNYLAREGDSMIGPIALGPPSDFTIDIDANNTINISPNLQNPQYSSNIQFEDVPTSDVLDIIAGAAFDGQLLVIRTFAPPVGGITISQGTIPNGGNIQTPDGNDFVMEDLQMVALVFDESLVINANTGGTWRVLPGFGGTGGGDPVVLKNLDEVDLGNQSLQLISIDWQVANFYRWRATGDNQIQFTNEPAAGKWEPMIIQITQDGVGGRLQNWNDAPFANGTPILNLNPNAVSTYKFYNYFDGISNVIYWSFWDTQSNQTPWLSNIDANQFILFDLADVIFTNAAINAPTAGRHSLFWSFSSGDQVMQIQPGNDFKIIQGDNELASQTVATFNDATIDFSIQTLPFTVLNVGDMLVKGISQFNKNMTLKTNNVAFPQPNFSVSTDVAGANDGGDLGLQARPWNNLNVKQIRLRDGFVIIDIASIAYDTAFNGTVYNVKNGESHLFKQFDGVASTDTLFEINETEIDAFTKNIVNVVDPVAPQDAATKAYVDSFVGGTWKIPVRAKADGFSFFFPSIQQVKDGVTMAVGDRILLTDELIGKNNGIWEVAGPFVGIPALAPLIRPSDFNSDSDMVSEIFVAVEEGTRNGQSVWHLVTPNPIIDNVTSQDWQAFRSGPRTDYVIGTANVPDDRYEDDGREWFGNDNGADGLSIALPAVEPGGFTISHTLTASDFPVGVPGLDFVEYGAMMSWVVENPTAGNIGVSVKTFFNGTEIGAQTGVTVGAGQFAGGNGMINTVDAQVGDTVELRLWGAVVGLDLVAWAVYTVPSEMNCFAGSCTTNLQQNNETGGDLDTLYAAAPDSFAAINLDNARFMDYGIGGGGSNFFTFTYGNGNPRLVKGEFARPDIFDNNNIDFSSAPARLPVPLIFIINQYSVVW